MPSLADWRDIIIIASGSLLILLFVVTLILALVALFGTRMLINASRALMDEQVTPTLESGKATAKQVQGTSVFISESAVRPVIRVYGIVAGTRRAFAILAGLSSRRGNGSEASD